MSLDTFQIIALSGLLAQFIIFPILGYRQYKKHKHDPFYKNWAKEQEQYLRNCELWEERKKEPKVLPKGFDKKQ